MKLTLAILTFLSVSIGVEAQKKKKKSKKSKALYAILDDGSSQIISTINFNPDDSALIHVAGRTANPSHVPCDSSENCKLYVKKGCTGTDLFTSTENYFTTTDGATNSAFTVEGLTYKEAAKASVVISLDGTEWCGKLMKAPSSFSIEASVDTYPGSTSSYTPTGTVSMTYGIDGTFTYAYDLEGLEPNCVGCGIHIHSGFTCDDASLVGGHYWNADFVRDLWTATGGAVYETDDDGKGSGYFKLYNGYDIFTNNNHAVVMHGQTGARLGCGVLKFTA